MLIVVDFPGTEYKVLVLCSLRVALEASGVDVGKGSRAE